MLLLPRPVVGVDRAEEAKAFQGFGLEGVLEKHRVFAGAEGRNAVGSPCEGEIVEAVLKNLADGSVFEDGPDKDPSGRFIGEGFPIAFVSLTQVPDRDDQGGGRSGGEANAGDLVPGGFDVDRGEVGDVAALEFPEVGEVGLDPDFTSGAANLWELGLALGLDEVHHGDRAEFPLAKDSGWVVCRKHFVSNSSMGG